MAEQADSPKKKRQVVQFARLVFFLTLWTILV